MSAVAQQSATLGFGLARLHHLFTARAREEILHTAIDASFVHFDVAPSYADGMAEAEMGRVLRARRSEITIGTKFGIPCSSWGARNKVVYYVRKAGSRLGARRAIAQRNFDPASVVNSLHGSLQRLRTDYVDYFFVHEPIGDEQYRQAAELFETLEQLKRDGKIRHYGMAAPAALSVALAASFGDAIQFEVGRNSSELVVRSSRTRRLFAYGLVRHLKSAGGQRIDLAAALRWFFSNFRGVVPLISTNRVSELRSLPRSLEIP